jgi:hypothetical protein
MLDHTGELFGFPVIDIDKLDGVEGTDVVLTGLERFNEDAMVEDLIARVSRQLGVTRDMIDVESVRAMVREWNGGVHA